MSIYWCCHSIALLLWEKYCVFLCVHVYVLAHLHLCMRCCVCVCVQVCAFRYFIGPQEKTHFHSLYMETLKSHNEKIHTGIRICTFAAQVCVCVRVCVSPDAIGH